MSQNTARYYPRRLEKEQRDRILLEQLPQVHYLARRIHSSLPKHVPLEDLVHTGVVGLIDALNKFDSSKHVQFGTYAKFRILSRFPTEFEMALELNLDLRIFQQLLNDLNGLEVHSLQVGPSWDGKEEDQCDCWANATEDTPLFHRMRSEMKELLTSMIADLPEQQRRVLALYYFEELTMKQVGTALGIGESRVSQVHGSAVANLRRQMENVLNAGKPATRAARAGQ